MRRTHFSTAAGKLLRNISAVVLIGSLSVFPGAAPAHATTASGIYVSVTCLDGNRGVYWKASSPNIPEEGFARNIGGGWWGFGVHDVPEDAHLTIGCGTSGTWRYWTDLGIFRSPRQSYWVNCAHYEATYRCPSGTWTVFP